MNSCAQLHNVALNSCTQQYNTVRKSDGRVTYVASLSRGEQNLMCCRMRVLARSRSLPIVMRVTSRVKSCDSA